MSRGPHVSSTHASEMSLWARRTHSYIQLTTLGVGQLVLLVKTLQKGRTEAIVLGVLEKLDGILLRLHAWLDTFWNWHDWVCVVGGDTRWLL